MRVLISFISLSETFLNLRSNERDVIKKCILIIMYSTLYVQYTICTVHYICSTLYVQYNVCTVHYMYSTLYVQYTVCTVHCVCSTLYIQYTICTVHYMYSTLYYCPILMKFEFSPHIFENSQISNFTKIRPVEAEFFHADGRTDVTKFFAAFCNFANAPVNIWWSHRSHIPHILIALNGCQTRLPYHLNFVQTLKPVFIYAKFSYGVVKVYLLRNLRVLVQLSKKGPDMRVLL